MIEKKLIVGRYIEIPNPVVPNPEENIGTIVTQAAKRFSIQQSTGFFSKQRTSAIAEGAHPTKDRRNFQWLAWLSGAVSQVAVNGVDVMTGPMSGCWLAIYKNGDGQDFAVHVGTDSSSEEKTNAAKTAWNNFAQSLGRGAVLIGFNPVRHWVGAIPKSIKGDLSLKVFG